MPTFSRIAEQSHRRALALANQQRHEYVTLEHLLLALVDDQDAATVMRASNVDIDKLRRNLVTYPAIRAGGPRHGRLGGLKADRRLSARDPARHDPCAVFGARGGDGRRRAGRDFC